MISASLTFAQLPLFKKKKDESCGLHIEAWTEYRSKYIPDYRSHSII